MGRINNWIQGWVVGVEASYLVFVGVVQCTVDVLFHGEVKCGDPLDRSVCPVVGAG